MKNHIKLRYLFNLIFLVFTQCISIGVSKNPEPAKNVSYSFPKSPFEVHKSKTGDKVWLSKKSGNTISFISDCASNADPSLDILENEALSGIDKIEILKSRTIDFNQRTAKETLAAGEVDGIAIKVNVLSFKKNSCNYTLLFAGKKDHFESELNHYTQFKESFKAP